MPDEAKDPYALLGVPRTASDAEIRRAYRRLIVETHRTGVLGLVDQIAALNRAYETLKDSAQRKAVDATPLRPAAPAWEPSGGPSPGLVELQLRAARDVQRQSVRTGERATQQHAGTMAEIENDFDRREVAIRRALKRRAVLRHVTRALALVALAAAVFYAKIWLEP